MSWEFILNVDKKIIKKVKGSAKGMEIQIASEQVG